LRRSAGFERPLAKTAAAAEPDVVIRVRGLTNSFGDQTVHEGLDLDVHRGEILGVVGGSGTGKSVLMRSIIGLQAPDAGEVEVFGEPMLGRDDLDAREVRRPLGRAVPERRALLDPDGGRECAGAAARIL
jgi:ABC-type transporter Mla maintaining outer membrane lipid asymmetry ATPase subunit MlaF